MYYTSSVVEEFDRYNTIRNIVSTEELNGDAFLGEKDADGNKLYKIIDRRIYLKSYYLKILKTNKANNKYLNYKLKINFL